MNVTGIFTMTAKHSLEVSRGYRTEKLFYSTPAPFEIQIWIYQQPQVACCFL